MKLLPCSRRTETANGSAGNAFRIGCIGLKEQWGSQNGCSWSILVPPEPPEEIYWRSLGESEICGTCTISWGHSHFHTRNKHRKCLLQLVPVLTHRPTIRMCEAEIPGVLKSQKLSVQEKNIGRLESAHAFLKSIENCENWPIKDIQSWISECERAPGITKSSQSCKHEKTWPMPKTSWARQSTLKRPSETLGQNFNGTFCWGMLASKLKNLTKVYKSCILIHTSRPTKLKCRDGYATYCA